MITNNEYYTVEVTDNQHEVLRNLLMGTLSIYSMFFIIYIKNTMYTITLAGDKLPWNTFYPNLAYLTLLKLIKNSRK